MKKKELKALAQKIAKAELIIQANEDEKAVQRAQEEIFELSGHVQNFDDIIAIDELVQEILSQNS